MIRTTHLTKHYGDVRAVHDVNVSVKEGEIVGFLGLNGAGKTTTFRMLLGMVTPTKGDCFLQGHKVTPSNTKLWQDVGYLIETPSAYGDLTVTENLEMMRRLRGISNTSSVTQIIEKLNLQDHATKKAKHLSRGNAQRLGIAKALLHRPKILLLDEPTNGLDTAGIVEVRELLLALAKESGVTILVSSHKLHEIAKLASRIAIIHYGELIKELATDELEGQVQKSLMIAGRDPTAQLNALAAAGFQAKMVGPAQAIRCDDAFAVHNPERIAALLVKEGQPPTMLKVEKEDLERYFLRTIGEVGAELDG